MGKIELTAYWGNGDAESAIKLTQAQWDKIKAGGEHERPAWSWYEGKRYSVLWVFADGLFSIYGTDGLDAVIDEPVEALSWQKI